MKRLLLRELCAAAVASSAFGLPSLVAQDSDKQGQEELFELSPFVVSLEDNDRYLATNQMGGTRLQTPIQELPMSIQIVPETLIKDMAAFEVEDAVRFVSGVTLNNRNDKDHGGESYVIRGFGTDMLLRNGIPFNAFTDAIIVQQIEVVKGPSSVLYGVSDPGGLVNTVTKRPLPENYRYVGTHVGSWDRYRAEYDFTGPIDAEGKLAYRMMGSWESRGDFRDYVDDEKVFNDIIFSYQPNRKHMVLFEYMEGQESNVANSRRSYPVLPTSPRQFADLGIDFMVGGPNDFQDLEQDLLDVTLESQWNHVFKSRVAYSKSNRNNDKYSNANTTIRDGVLVKNPQREMYDLQQDNIFIDLVADYGIGETRHTTLVGAQYRTDDWVFSNFIWEEPTPGEITRKNVLFNDPVNPSDFDPNQSLEDRYWMPPLDELVWVTNPRGEGAPSIREETREGYFISHQARMLDDRLRLMAGLRYDLLSYGRNDDISGLDQFPDIDIAELSEYSQTTPQLGFNYEIKDGLAFYAGYNESFVPNTPAIVVDLETKESKPFNPAPQDGTAYEVGFKYELFGRKLVGTFAAFSIEKTNVVSYNKGYDPETEEPFSVSPLARAEGIEFDAVWSPNQNFQAIFAYAHHDANDLDIETGEKIRALQGSAKNNISTWVNYTYTEGMLNGLSWNVGFEWKDGPIYLFPSTGKTRFITQGDYTSYDFAVRYSRPINEQVSYTVALNLKNALDNEYMDKTGYWADPRNYNLSVSFNF
ncbi:TonB-dependent siderophore receptor [Pelagicoccus mobilis]|uniref:TonB-dependent receptor n=1 Tax=Pelagicoccus mobilis TaxID=415221 RepID=A0A934RXT2_9BACT|nr:TonB-dependent receptor [Pelagicoccus mobilis]MBK1877199.1 TonB-dependent receptor [Pelagicoccus mobilis]